MIIMMMNNLHSSASGFADVFVHVFIIPACNSAPYEIATISCTMLVRSNCVYYIDIINGVHILQTYDDKLVSGIAAYTQPPDQTM